MLRRAFLRAMRFLVLPAAAAALFTGALVQPAWTQTQDIILFADESLKTSIEGANAFFLSENAFTVIVTYGSSAELARRLEGGAMADVFISAGPQAMDALAGRKLIETSSRADVVRKASVTYPIAVMTSSTNVLASIYVQWLTTPKAQPYFEKEGFTFLP
jgi:ABC-type molybdate transport system substrate-binding protein